MQTTELTPKIPGQDQAFYELLVLPTQEMLDAVVDILDSFIHQLSKTANRKELLAVTLEKIRAVLAPFQKSETVALELEKALSAVIVNYPTTNQSGPSFLTRYLKAVTTIWEQKAYERSLADLDLVLKHLGGAYLSAEGCLFPKKTKEDQLVLPKQHSLPEAPQQFPEPLDPDNPTEQEREAIEAYNQALEKLVSLWNETKTWVDALRHELTTIENRVLRWEAYIKNCNASLQTAKDLFEKIENTFERRNNNVQVSGLGTYPTKNKMRALGTLSSAFERARQIEEYAPAELLVAIRTVINSLPQQMAELYLVDLELPDPNNSRAHIKDKLGRKTVAIKPANGRRNNTQNELAMVKGKIQDLETAVYACLAAQQKKAEVEGAVGRFLQKIKANFQPWEEVKTALGTLLNADNPEILQDIIANSSPINQGKFGQDSITGSYSAPLGNDCSNKEAGGIYTTIENLTPGKPELQGSMRFFKAECKKILDTLGRFV